MWMSVYARRSLPWTWPVIQNYGMGVVAWVAITPLMLASARRNSLRDGQRWWRAALHVVLACCFALLHIALWQTLVRSQRPFWGSGYFETMLWTVMLYAVLLALSSYHEFADWLRERETATARLRAEIAEAELTSSAMRFDPENVLARLECWRHVLRDAPMAERALTRAHRCARPTHHARRRARSRLGRRGCRYTSPRVTDRPVTVLVADDECRRAPILRLLRAESGVDGWPSARAGEAQ